MCVVSNLGDQWGQTFPYRWPQVPLQPAPYDVPHPFEPVQDALRECVHCGNERGHFLHAPFEPDDSVSRADFEKLREEMEELKELLKAAKRFDEATGQPDCEMDEKIELIRRVADMVGVDVDEVFGSRDE